MATISNRGIVDSLIANDGYYMGDPRVYMIVEYTTQWGDTTWGVTWINESPERRVRYTIPSDFVINPKVIWQMPPEMGYLDIPLRHH